MVVISVEMSAQQINTVDKCYLLRLYVIGYVAIDALCNTCGVGLDVIVGPAVDVDGAIDVASGHVVIVNSEHYLDLVATRIHGLEVKRVKVTLT